MVRRVSTLAVALLSCADPTQIRLELSTDMSCDVNAQGDVLDSFLVAAASSLQDGPIAESASVDGCSNPKDLGSLVLAPDAGRVGDAVEVVVIAGVKRGSTTSTAADCLKDLNKDLPVGKNCVVVRRKLGFVSGVSLVLPLEIQAECVAVDCEATNQTCRDGECTDPKVTCGEADPFCDGGGGSGAGPNGGGGSGAAPNGGGGSGASGGAGPTTGGGGAGASGAGTSTGGTGGTGGTGTGGDGSGPPTCNQPNGNPCYCGAPWLGTSGNGVCFDGVCQDCNCDAQACQYYCVNTQGTGVDVCEGSECTCLAPGCNIVTNTFTTMCDFLCPQQPQQLMLPPACNHDCVCTDAITCVCTPG